MIGVQRSISLFTKAASACWPRLGLVRHHAAELEQPLARRLVVERLVERVAELVEDGLRRALRGEQGVPGLRLEFRQPASLLVGTFGRDGLRSGVPIA